jgi:hypothetical protein
MKKFIDNIVVLIEAIVAKITGLRDRIIKFLKGILE